MKRVFIILWAFFSLSSISLKAQPIRKLTFESISMAIEETWKNAPYDSSRPGYHLVPRAGFMEDPNNASAPLNLLSYL